MSLSIAAIGFGLNRHWFCRKIYAALEFIRCYMFHVYVLKLMCRNEALQFPHNVYYLLTIECCSFNPLLKATVATDVLHAILFIITTLLASSYQFLTPALKLVKFIN